jgi:hypothetical protein
MKQKIFIPVVALMILLSCTKNENNPQISPANSNELKDQTLEQISSRRCASYEILQEQLKTDPGLAKRMREIEELTEKVIKNPAAYRRLADGSIEIPVHVNVLYRTSAENISNTQIQSQIDVMNEDFGGTNADRSLIPSVFSGVFAGDTRIKFTWSSSTGLTRKSTTKTSWSANNNDMKISSRGGISPTSPTTKLNVWVCTLSNGILGFAQFPGGASSTDGVVILNTAFGRTGSVRAPFNKGRTAVHEVGHWLNLRHIWGDGTCASDGVGDTPPHRTANYGCPGVVSLRCTSNSTTNPQGFTREMTMNYMDYVDDACMYMFTLNQSSRMNATFAVGGPRNSFAQP